MSNLSPPQKELWKRIQSILREKWDPIGVYEPEGEWSDEYDSYVPHVFRLAIEGKGHARIAGSLAATATQNMGLSASNNIEHEIKVAKLIIQAKEEILGK